MSIPIVLAAFGTTTRALETYTAIDGVFRERYPETDIRWAYSSRMVRDFIKARKNIDLRHPHEVLADLAGEGHPWAVVQSVHLLCGHEFYRLVAEVRECDIRTTVGLPLLSCPPDYIRVARILRGVHRPEKGEALVLVGHGTDHPAWAAYMAMNQVFREVHGPGVHVGMIEGEHLTPEQIRDKLLIDGFRRARLVPFMMVAGVHFRQDMDGASDSWRSVFEAAGIRVDVEGRGLGLLPEIGSLLADHAGEAADVTPLRRRENGRAA